MLLKNTTKIILFLVVFFNLKNLKNYCVTPTVLLALQA
ncbi:hypothetical protein ACIVBQ_000909 [Tenacibaculum discolor]